MPPEDVARLQIITDADVHIGAALMGGRDGEPSVGRTLVLELEHRTNQSSHDIEPLQTLFGLDQDSAVFVTGRLLVAIDVAFGRDVVRELLTEAARAAGRLAAEDEKRHGLEGEQ
jgi:hypothetical protein